MAGERSALIVATYVYDDPRLAQLRAPERDAEALAGVLSDPTIGGFEVTTIVNRPWHEVSLAIARFFQNRRSDDLLVLHFSCHGLKDNSGELYFAATDTTLDLLEATAVPSASVNRVMNRSRAGRVVLFLDCCYSGAFARGMTARAGGVVDGSDRLGGHGRAVITASSALQFAFEGDAIADGDVAASQPSVFTSALVRGLSTGDADRDLDGWVSLDELYSFVHDEVTRINPDQTPTKWAFDIEGDLQIARRGTPVSTPAKLPRPILESMRSLYSWERGSAVEPLTELLNGDHPGLALAARQALETLALRDDSDKVKAAAQRALRRRPEIRAATGSPAKTETETGTETETDSETDSETGSGPEVDIGSETAIETETDAETDTETQAETQAETGGETGTKTKPDLLLWLERVPVRARAGLGVALVAMVAVVLGFFLLGNRGEGDSNGGDGGSTTLAPEDIVLAQEHDGPRQLVVAHGDGTTTVLIDDDAATRPSLNATRDAMVYLREDPERRTVPFLAQGFSESGGLEVDRPLIRDRRDDCPYANRPAWSSDGVHLALICRDESDAKTLRIATVDGGLDDPLLEWDSLAGGPSWGDDGNIYFAAEAAAGSPYDALYAIPNGGGDPRAVASEDLRWLTEPDWGEPGLLYLSAPGWNAPGTLKLLQRDGTTVELDTRGPVTWPAWSPDYAAIAWLAPDEAGDMRLWTAPFTGASDGGPELGRPTEFDVGGAAGVPAWGSR